MILRKVVHISQTKTEQSRKESEKSFKTAWGECDFNQTSVSIP